MQADRETNAILPATHPSACRKGICDHWPSVAVLACLLRRRICSAIYGTAIERHRTVVEDAAANHGGRIVTNDAIVECRCTASEDTAAVSCRVSADCAIGERECADMQPIIGCLIRLDVAELG